MLFFFTVVVLFFALAVGGALFGMKIYVRPKEALDRVSAGAAESEDVAVHPSLAFHDLMRRLGNIVPQSPKDVTVMQRRLIRAGIRGKRAEGPVRRKGRAGHYTFPCRWTSARERRHRSQQ